MKKGKNPAISFNHIALNAQRQGDKILEKISSIIESGIFLNGEENERLGKNISSFLGGGYVATVASGHDALSLALSSLHLTKNDEIIFPVNAYPTAFPIALSGAKIIPVDVNENGQIDLHQVKQKLSKRTKAIVIVHLYGLVGEIDATASLIKGRGIILVEDCAQAFGSIYKGKPVGTFGDISCFSFYPTKNIGTLGDGGVLYTRDKKLYEYFVKARSYGEKSRYESLFVSFHSRLAEIQSGILNVYFSNLESDFENRRRVADYYKKKLREANLLRWVRVFESHPESFPVQHLFVIEAKERSDLQIYLKKIGVPTQIHYPVPVHLVPAFSFLNYKKGDFPMSERLSKGILSLPFHPFLSEDEINYIVSNIKRFYHG